MKKNVLTFGIISGLIVSLFMAIATMLTDQMDLDHSMIIGYTVMILAFVFIYVGIKNYRDKYNNGAISFGRAFSVGILIALIACSFYVVTWAIEYNFFMPDFLDKYGDHMIKKLREGGAAQSKIDETIAELNQGKEMYKNPIYFVLITFAEIFPVGLLITLISAAILRKKRVDGMPVIDVN